MVLPRGDEKKKGTSAFKGGRSWCLTVEAEVHGQRKTGVEGQKTTRGRWWVSMKGARGGVMTEWVGLVNEEKSRGEELTVGEGGMGWSSGGWWMRDLQLNLIQNEFQLINYNQEYYDHKEKLHLK